MAAPSLPELPTDLVAGKYRISRLIGQGGMGSVWEGFHNSLGTRVAVKFIDAAFADSDEARSRFENEARAAARLNSKYAVQVYDHGLMPDGRPFIVMEFLSGEPLDSRLDREGRIPPGETARILGQACRALGRAHGAGIVHRDLKPENIFLVWDDEDQAHVAKVVDFGIAKFTDATNGISSATRTGSVLGTPYYMSPEQARGLRTVDCRSDLWSLGVIAFRCIVGRLPFEGEAIGDLLVKICTGPVPVPTQCGDGIPPLFDAWFARAMQRDPAMRFTHVAELAEQLNMACGVGGRAPMGSSNMESPPLGAMGSMPRPGSTTPVNIAGLGFTPFNNTPGPNFTPSATAAIRSGSYGGGITPNPVMHTPTPTGVRSSSGRGLLMVGGLGALVVVGAVVAVFATRLGGSAAKSPEASVVAAAVAPPANAPPPAQVPAAPLPQVVPVVAPVAPVDVASPAASVDPTSADADRPRRATAAPRPPRPGSPRPAAAAVEPATPPPPPPPPPRPAGQGRGGAASAGIDIGY